jgi:nitrogenase molybdenum-cofactor synthesis protein NifE
VRQKADLLVAGVKERFLAYKMKIAFCDFNHDRTVNFEGYEGMMNFAREVSVSINSPVWQLPLNRASGIVKRIGLESRTEVSSSDISESCYS